MKNPIIIALVVAIVVGVGAFFGGVKFQETKASSNGQQLQENGTAAAGHQGNPNDQEGPNGQRFQRGFRPVTGVILSMDDKSITVKLDDGSSKIILLQDNLTVSKTDTATKADLKTGVKVGVFGTNNSDGSVTAQNIQINPMFRTGQGEDNRQSSSTSSPR